MSPGQVGQRRWTQVVAAADPGASTRRAAWAAQRVAATRPRSVGRARGELGAGLRAGATSRSAFPGTVAGPGSLSPAARAWDAYAPPILLGGSRRRRHEPLLTASCTDDAGRWRLFQSPCDRPFRGGRRGAYSKLSLLPAGSPRGFHGAWRAPSRTPRGILLPRRLVRGRTPRGILLPQSMVRSLPLEAGLPLRGASRKGVRSPS